MAQKDGKKQGVEDQQIKKVRITFSSTKLSTAQHVTNKLVTNSKNFGIKITGPVRLPNKHLRICCRRTPCGEGSKTWDNWEMTMFKRYVDLQCTAGQLKDVTAFDVPSGIQINVDIKTA